MAFSLALLEGIALVGTGWTAISFAFLIGIDLRC